ncbi:MAG: hypothetical protein ACRD22_06325 [Terriglobia bacterium]
MLTFPKRSNKKDGKALNEKFTERAGVSVVKKLARDVAHLIAGAGVEKPAAA